MLTVFDIRAKIISMEVLPFDKNFIKLRIVSDVILKSEFKHKGKETPRDQEDKITGTNMKELHINLAEATNYLIQLFYQTNKKFSCTRTKLGKLLSILAFTYALHGEIAFDQAIVKYNTCGTTIDGLASYADRDVYIQLKYEDQIEKVTETLDELQVIPEKHTNISSLSNETKEKILDVFCAFGSFPAFDLGQNINQIIQENGVTEPDGKINLQKIYQLDKDCFEGRCNELVDYLF